MILIFLLVSSVASLLAADETFFIQWNKLLHRENQVNQSFWLAGNHASDEEELKKTIERFNSTDFLDTNAHPQCKFPARRLLIQKYLGKNLFQESKCPDYDEWIKKLNPQGISVVFAGNYPDNPGSLFGHTFIKIESKDSKNEILDYALNYSAEVSDDIGFLYAVKGLIGAYYGGFSLSPYYMKLNEYAEAEGRDIWEYKTTLTPEDAHLILAHIWELKYQAEFRYFFLSDNCSYFILNLLDIARPDLKLENKMPWYVIPLETVKVMNTASGVITDTTYRPSVRLRSETAYSQLNISEQAKVRDILKSDNNLENETNSRILKVASMQIAAIHSQKDGKLSLELAEKEESLLARLSELPTDKSFATKTLPSPHQGHDITQVSIGGIFDSNQDLLLGYRTGVHDLNDYATGYLPYSELSIMDSSFRVNTDRFKINQVKFLSMKLFRPWNLNQRDWSWTVNFSYENQSTVFSRGTKQLTLDGNFGIATQSFDSFLFAAMLGAHIHAENFDIKESAGLMGDLYLLYSKETWKLVNRIKFLQDINFRSSFGYQIIPTSSLSYHSNPNWDYQIEFTYPVYLEHLQSTPSSLVLKMDYHF